MAEPCFCVHLPYGPCPLCSKELEDVTMVLEHVASIPMVEWGEPHITTVMPYSVIRAAKRALSIKNTP